MKKALLLIVILSLAYCNLPAQVKKVNVSGRVVLNQPYDYSNLKITLKRVAPDIFQEIIQTDTTGLFKHEIIEGIYDISISCKYYEDTAFIGIPIFNDNNFSDIRLRYLCVYLTGDIEGTLVTGEYNVKGNLIVPAKKTLIIEKGVKLKFYYNSKFVVNGILIAEGTDNSRILFTSFVPGEYWGGINLNSNYDTSLTISMKYITIEYSNGMRCERYWHLDIDNLIYQNNIGNFYIESYGYNVKLRNSTIINNKCPTGGAIYLNGTGVLIENCLISKNETGSSAGGIAMSEGSYSGGPPLKTFLKNTIISNNNSIGNGGAILTHETELINCIIINNISGYINTAIYIPNYSTCKIYNTIIANNITIWNGNTISSYQIGSSIASSVKLNNCLFYSPSKLYWDRPAPYFNKLIKTNFNGDSTDAYGNIFLEPRFVDTASGDYHLLPTSPCIDAGINSSDLSQTDFDGKIRIWAGKEENNAFVDIGAYEYGAPKYSSNVDEPVNNNDDVFLSPNPASEFIDISISNGNYFGVTSIVPSGEILIFNTIGEPVLVKQFSSNLQRLNISFLAPGMYFVQVGNQFQKFVKLQ
ncbi:MAG: Por secretion system C-terminal sorting protein [Ignavibacteria bacterium]|nr:Por secretion system C-terminal sorting protein [Ignavibacteria bacterium]